jgi:ATP-dependent DNA helicase PIF1
MHTLDIITVILSFVGALFVCCMLATLAKRGALLKPYNPKRSPLFCIPHPARTPLPSPPARSLTHLPRTRSPTSHLQPPTASPTTTPRHYFGYLSTRLHTTTTMFKSAVQNHNAIASTSPPNNAYKQASLGNTFNRTGAKTSSTRPVANETKPAIGATIQGTKRTSNGLAKSLGSPEDDFDYPPLKIAGFDEKENELPAAFHASSRNNPGVLAQALFDEDDFDSDIDLDVEDPATKGTVTYPTLPRVASGGSADSGYNSRAHTADIKPEQPSSQPIPWSSSPLSHYKTPQRPEPPKTKRRTLPWTQSQKQQPIQEEEEEDIAPPRKRVTKEAEKAVSTPAKESKSQYPWNATASAIKQQQKTLKETNKAQAKANQGTDEDMKEAIKKKKKNTIHKIFLSEEQQNVLNLVTEYKKSVFFTGSAGMWTELLI